MGVQSWSARLLSSALLLGTGATVADAVDQLPDAAAVGRTEDIVQRVEDIALNTPGVKHTVAISGQSILLNANAPNFGAIYLMLDDFDHRRGLSSDAIANKLEDQFQKRVPEASVNIFAAAPVERILL